MAPRLRPRSASASHREAGGAVKMVAGAAAAGVAAGAGAGAEGAGGVAHVRRKGVSVGHRAATTNECTANCTGSEGTKPQSRRAGEAKRGGGGEGGKGEEDSEESRIRRRSRAGLNRGLLLHERLPSPYTWHPVVNPYGI